MTTHRIGRESIHTYWSNALEPRLTAEPGDTVVYETIDCDYGEIARRIDDIAGADVSEELKAFIRAEAYPEVAVTDRYPDIMGWHPLTGPVALAGTAATWICAISRPGPRCTCRSWCPGHCSRSATCTPPRATAR